EAEQARRRGGGEARPAVGIVDGDQIGRMVEHSANIPDAPDGATVGAMVENPRTGERITFAIDTPELLAMQVVWPRPGHRAAEHIHPEMEERYVVEAGTAAFRIGGVERTAGPGGTVGVPPGTPHLAWTLTADDERHRILVIANQTVGGEELRQEILQHAGSQPLVRVVAPVLPTRAHYITSDIDGELADAQRRLDTTLAWLREKGIEATGRVG